NYLRVPDDVIDFTPELRAQALDVLKGYKVGDSPFTPPMLGNINGILGAVGAGTATNWPGSAADPETHVVYAQAGNTPSARSLVVMGDPQVTTTPEHPRGAMLRAYDKQTGKEVGAIWMPAQQSGSPMTYMVDGKQYIVVAVSGGNYSGEYIAFALPASATRTPTGGQ